MRNISFSLTAEQIRNRTKTVTRRLGWEDLKPGTFLQPVVKGQGLKKGEHVETIGGPIEIVDVRRERLSRLLVTDVYTRAEVVAEGFPELSEEQFVRMFCEHNDCRPGTWVTRIAFTYPTTLPIETIAYQARVAADNRPCGSRPCTTEFPGMPSRWCSNCLIAALLERLAIPPVPALPWNDSMAGDHQ